MKKMVKLIAIDLDQTLLRNNKTISDYSAKVLKECQARGIIVAFATARSVAQSKRYVEQIEPNATVNSGGALVCAGIDVIYRRPMSVKVTNTLLQLLCSAEESIGYITIEINEGLFTNMPYISTEEFWTDSPSVVREDFSTNLDVEAFKVITSVYNDEILDTIASALPSIYVIKYTDENVVTFFDKGAGKRQGVTALATHYNIALEEIVAFGDDYNDLEMLKGGGVGVAMDNAIDETKDAADYICDTNENDGVAKWIEENLLNHNIY